MRILAARWLVASLPFRLRAGERAGAVEQREPQSHHQQKHAKRDEADNGRAAEADEETGSRPVADDDKHFDREQQQDHGRQNDQPVENQIAHVERDRRPGVGREQSEPRRQVVAVGAQPGCFARLLVRMIAAPDEFGPDRIEPGTRDPG